MYALKTTLVKAVLLLTFLTNVSVWACPKMCVCKWKNGKQTVECNDKNLNSIPAGMDPGTQVLEFSGNKLRKLQEQKFLKMDLINLQRIYLAKCGIISVHHQTFKGLSNLVELDLSGNLLETIPTEAFIDTPSLMRLTLSSNPIKKLRKASFSHLSFLNTLELSNCQICLVEEGAFQGLHSLEWLHLDGNKLTTLKGNKVLPDSLKGIELQGNLWECDCHMLELHAWLLDFNIPHAVQPLCIGPNKVKGKPIKNVPLADLACLPDVSPTTFYLEIAEGKNVSLLCHVRAIPEAQVSWWFQGQLLQNDTLIAPGMRLYYYLEEGHEDKKSELFIYNVNSEDNGTYICNAENPAGMAQSNFSIRIIVKEEPIVIIVSFPFEYLLAAVIGAAVLIVVLIIVIIVLIVKCRRYRRRQLKREKTKEVALQYQQTAAKCSMYEGVDQLPDPLKQTFSEVDRQQEMMFYAATRSSEDLLRTMSPVVPPNQIRSPSSLRRYQLEQNPDLINDTESVGRRREGDGEDVQAREIEETEQGSALVHPGLVQFPVGCLRGSRKLYSMNSWDPGYALDSEGYPVDFGLPKIHAAQSNENFYRTLPYNRAGKRQSAANPMSRYSREAEFLSRAPQPAAYEHYCPDVRYTADGYPARAAESTGPPNPQPLGNLQELESIAKLAPNVGQPVGEHTSVQHSNLQNSNVHNSNVQNSNVQSSNVQSSNVQSSNVQKSNVQHPNVQHSNVQHPNVQHPNVQHPNVQHPNLQHPIVHHPYVHNPNVQHSNVHHNLEHASLQNPNFEQQPHPNSQQGHSFHSAFKQPNPIYLNSQPSISQHSNSQHPNSQHPNSQQSNPQGPKLTNLRTSQHPNPQCSQQLNPTPQQQLNLQQLPSPPEGYKSDSPAPSSLPCCSSPQVQWPACVPANLHMLNKSAEVEDKKSSNVTKRCVSAQTDSECSASPPPSEHVTASNKSESIVDGRPNEGANEALTESPDEGYEGEPAVV